ncbi:MAG: methylmalonyl-CoA carboxyltransferase, partial [Chloroflexus aggregans]
MTMHARLAALRQYRHRLEQGGGPERIARQHQAGKLTARERLHILIDHDTFQELYLFARHRCTAFGMADKEMPGEGVVTGRG